MLSPQVFCWQGLQSLGTDGSLYSGPICFWRKHAPVALLVEGMLVCTSYVVSRLLLQVFMIAYCRLYRFADYEECKQICQAFVNAVEEIRPEVMKKSKIHLLLHLADDMSQFGPTSAYNTERYSN